MQTLHFTQNVIIALPSDNEVLKLVTQAPHEPKERPIKMLFGNPESVRYQPEGEGFIHRTLRGV